MKRFLFLLLFVSHAFSCALFANLVWTPNLSFQAVLNEAQKRSPYHMGLLAIYLRSGEAGCVVDLQKSAEWSTVAWKEGHPFGAYNLANLAMLDGDFSKATQYYQDAALLLQRKASEGDPVAMYCMGEIDFQVIPTNVPRALDWFLKSADAGYPQSQATIGALFLKGLPGLLEKDSRKGIEYLTKAVKAKSLTARFNLGMAYYNGDGVGKDSSKAVQWLTLAEKQNFAEAQYVLGRMYFEGDDLIRKDQSKGVNYLKKASAQNHLLAKRYLEDINGEESPSVPFTKSPRPLPKANSAASDNHLEEAKMYYTGIGRDQDYNKAFALLLPFAEEGNPEASRLVGLMCFTGKGTTKNISAAEKWLRQAAESGDSIARRMLSQYQALFRQ
jgi:TPR repeat protein